MADRQTPAISATSEADWLTAAAEHFEMLAGDSCEPRPTDKAAIAGACRRAATRASAAPGPGEQGAAVADAPSDERLLDIYIDGYTDSIVAKAHAKDAQVDGFRAIWNAAVAARACILGCPETVRAALVAACSDLPGFDDAEMEGFDFQAWLTRTAELLAAPPASAGGPAVRECDEIIRLRTFVAIAREGAVRRGNVEQATADLDVLASRAAAVGATNEEDAPSEDSKAWAFIRDMATNYDHESDAHRYGHYCYVCEAEKLLASRAVAAPVRAGARTTTHD